MHTHTHSFKGEKNPNFPGAEVCGIESEQLIQKVHYSPSAVSSVWAITPSTHTSGVYHLTESVMGPEKQRGGSGIVLDQRQTKFILMCLVQNPLYLWCNNLMQADFKSAIRGVEMTTRLRGSFHWHVLAVILEMCIFSRTKLNSVQIYLIMVKELGGG